MSNYKEFKSLEEASHWFKSKGYTWYTNTLKDPDEALRGVEELAKINHKKYTYLSGKFKETYLIYYKEG